MSTANLWEYHAALAWLPCSVMGDPLTWSHHSHSPVPGCKCMLPGSAACGHRKCDNEGRRRQCRWLDEEGNEDNTSLGRWRASHPANTHADTNAVEKRQIFNVLLQTDGSGQWSIMRVFDEDYDGTLRKPSVYWLLHRWGEGSVHSDSVRLQTHTYSWCTRPPPTVHWSDTRFPGTNRTLPSLQRTGADRDTHPHTVSRLDGPLRLWKLAVLAGFDTLALVAAFSRNLHLFLAI